MQFRDGFSFGFDERACKECGGKCCIGEGFVFVSVEEANRIANFLGMDLVSFGKKYLRKIGYKYALIETKAECVFLGSNFRCKIYEVRPKNCATFPFWDVFKENPDGAFRECIGVVKK